VFAAKTLTMDTSLLKLERGSLFAERYEVIEELGQGGMGSVYRVMDRKINEEVALKLLRPEIAADQKTITRFANEMKLARKIAQRNVCKMYDLGEEEGIHYITMEYVPGEDLKSIIKMTRQLSVGAAIKITKQICEGLAEAHRLGIVHRDLKSNNILIDKEGNARIMDFGLASSLAQKRLTGKGVVLGTPDYISPEQVEGTGIDPRSDIYSLGVILYEMLTGQVPFVGDTALSIALKHKSETPRDPAELNPELPKALSLLILQCLEKDKQKRIQNAAELLSKLHEIEASISTTKLGWPKEKMPISKGRRETFPQPWRVVIILVVAVIAIGLGILYIVSHQAPPSPSGKPMLVVLPFENLGPPEDDYFADGLTEEITSRLSALHGLGVISRTSAKHYKRTEKSTQQIGQELGVDYLLEGTVRWNRSPDGKGRVRVTPQLIRVSDDTHLWSDRYERVIEDLFFVQSEIADQVTKKLDITVLEPERQALKDRPTGNIEAFDCALRAGEHTALAWRTLDVKEFDKAVALYERAVELDPDFIYAYITLCVTHTLAYSSGVDRTPERLAKARSAVDKALELEPEMPEVKSALGLYYYRGLLDYDRALEMFEAVQRARPNSTSPFIGYIQRRQGKWEQSISTLEEVFKLNPRNSDLAHQIGLSLLRMHRYDAAREWFDRSISLDQEFYFPRLAKAEIPLLSEGNSSEARALLTTLPPHQMTDRSLLKLSIFERKYEEATNLLSALPYDSFYGPSFYFHKNLAYALVYYQKRESSSMMTYAESALTEIQKALKENPEDPRLHAALGLVYACLGHIDDAVREGNRAISLYPVSKDAMIAPQYILDLARIYLILEEYEMAINLLEHLLSIEAGNIMTVPLLRVDPFWDPLRNDPRFRRLLEGN